MNREQFRKKFGLGKRSNEVKCSVCGKTMTVPTMYSENVRNDVLHPFCATATILISQWLMHHGWHVSSIEANPPHMYYCPRLFPQRNAGVSRIATRCRMVQAGRGMDEKRGGLSDALRDCGVNQRAKDNEHELTRIDTNYEIRRTKTYLESHATTGV